MVRNVRVVLNIECSDDSEDKDIEELIEIVNNMRSLIDIDEEMWSVEEVKEI